MRRWLIRGYWPIYGIAALSFVGWLFFSSADNAALHFVFASQWSPQYFALTPFMHASFIHVLFNTLALHFIGGQLLLPILKTRRFVQLFVLAALAGNVANSLLSASPAVGISAAVLGMLACALYSYGRVPVKLLLIHDLLRLRPFPLWTIATFLVALDIVGIVFGWGFFAHWAHLAGFAVGGAFGWVIFRKPQKRRYTVH
ncbi:rhomboid family intramembrane serine protease [Candidatus Persebacteraceae bacterium Df01]|uniref:Rhomboid family intramembrane serine protease n=1 Tax=Candidatus Doriopsillibacter californiensis TaxID=2970740 RepID=A0ABT7QKQ4_9GAMM|nr:rhomboid family intramembrane serine protease [Candidatus Persebacteraceae bacterium Df01]